MWLPGGCEKLREAKVLAGGVPSFKRLTNKCSYFYIPVLLDFAYKPGTGRADRA